MDLANVDCIAQLHSLL